MLFACNTDCALAADNSSLRSSMSYTNDIKGIHKGCTLVAELKVPLCGDKGIMMASRYGNAFYDRVCRVTWTN